ncbi:tail fiber assembly protein [Citrobacter sp. RHBSTW-00570]|uniref:tail fiber assembly protein n=1 Tax=Citrobacter sp. RHBSTW-00570 TaxID=2742655 RepID=UPI000AC37AAD
MAQVTQATQQKESLLMLAKSEIDWRLDAVGEGMETEEKTAALSEWRKYRVLLNRITPADAPDIDWSVSTCD